MHEVLPLFPVLLPSVPFEERCRLPHVSGVYFALTHDGDVLYVGATQNLYQRWMSHHHIQKLEVLSCRSIAYYACEITMLASTEQAMISQFEPRLNAAGGYTYKSASRTSNVPSVKATLYLDEALWIAFRNGCWEHKTSASKVVQSLIVEQLARWQSTHKKEKK